MEIYLGLIMAKIIDLPIYDRPREKAMRFGIDSLSDHELLALLIGSGTIDNSAMDIAYQMISDSHGLFHLIEKPYIDLINYKGIAEGKAVKIIAAFELAKRFKTHNGDEEEYVFNSDQIYKKYRPIIANLNQENVYLVVLDKKKRILHEVNLYKGSEANVQCSSLEIVRQVIAHRGHYFYLIHNHPSGSTLPSNDDVMFTTELIRKANRLSIILLDHLIMTRSSYYSFLRGEETRL